MPSPADVPILIRQIQGTNIADEPVFIGPSFLQRSDNWLPDVTYRLAKRKGTAIYANIPPVVTYDALLRTYDILGNRYLFAIGLDAIGVGRLYVSTNDGTPVQVGPDFGAPFARYGMAVLGSAVYVGNGVDFIRRIDLPGLTSTELLPLPLTNETGATVTAAADVNTNLQTGTYSYVWGVYDSPGKKWVSVGHSTGDMVATFTLGGTGNSLTFKAPTTALPAGQLYHVFVTLPDAAIETATDQVPEGLAAGVSLTIRDIVFTSTPVPIAEVSRRGNILVAHRDRIWFAGNVQKPSRIFATSTIVPGLEQSIFDIGDFFPWDAEEPVGEGDGDVITGLAVAALTSTNRSPASPLAILKHSSTWLFLGDITQDPTAQLVQISGKVGCASPQTVISTRWGVVFCGQDSVYLLPASLTEPLDIGWPIAPAILSIPPDRHDRSFAFYQLGFYHLVITPPGASENLTMWSLDMRRGPGAPRGFGPVPSWWGPHTIPGYTTATVASLDMNKIDRGFLALPFNATLDPGGALWNFALWNAALWGSLPTQGLIVENEQATETEVYSGVGPVPVVSVLKTAALDDGDAFGRKIFSRFRADGRAQEDTTFEVCLLVDELPVECRNGTLAGGGGALWNFALWNSALWGGPGSIVLLVGEQVDPAAEGDEGVIFGTVDGRPVGRQGEVVVTHREAVAVTLRDLELRYLPDVRPVR